MTGRKQSVKINNDHYSDWKLIQRGVPQGSILGPILFIIFINDLPLVVQDKLFLYADDTAVICEERNEELLLRKMKHSSEQLNKWFNENGLKINSTKTEVIKFGNYSELPTQMKLLNSEVTLAKQVTFLGLCIDSNLNWKMHIEKLYIKLSKAIYIIRYLKNIVSENCLLNIYYAYFHANLVYGILFWGNSSNAHKIFLLQKKCIRIMAGVRPRHSCRELFKKYNILTLYDVFILDCALFINKNRILFHENVSKTKHDTRNREKLQLLQTNLSVVQRGVRNAMIRIDNQIPQHLKTDKQFKKKLKKRLIEECNYSLKHYLK